MTAFPDPLTTSDRPWPRIVLVGLSVALVGLIGAFLPQAWCAPVIRYGGIPAMATLLGWFWISLWQAGVCRLWADTLRARQRAFWSACAIVFACGMWIHVREPHGFKIMMDEAIQMVTSEQMHLDHTTGTMLRGIWAENQFIVTNDMIDKRPLLFPFLVALVHGVTGFRPENGVVLNALLTPVFLGLVYWILRRWADRVIAVAGLLLLISAGVFGQNMTGSGFEILNVALYAGVGVALWFFARRPDAWTCSLFLAVVALQVNVRYESAVMVLPATLGFLWVVLRNPQLLRRWSIYLAPFALLPLLLIMRVIQERPEFWQLKEIPGATTPFSVRYFYQNIGHAMVFLFAPSGKYGNSPALAVLGVVGSVFFLVRAPRLIARLRQQPTEDALLALWATGGLLHAIFVMFYAWARFDDVMASRLAIPMLLSFTVFAVWALNEFTGRINRPAFSRSVLLASMAYLVFFYGTAATHLLYLRDNPAAETANWINDLAKDVSPRETLVVDDVYRHVWCLNRVSVTLPQVLADRPEQFRWVIEHQVYKTILIVQAVFAVDEDGKMGTSPWFDISDWAKTELVGEKRLTPEMSTRILRLESVDWEKFEHWRERVKDTPLRPEYPIEPLLRFREKILENVL